jgi:putative ATP-dependent endonuclease of the OLD family
LGSGSFGHGFQRHLIFTLLRVASSAAVSGAKTSATAAKKKGYAPELSLILFEEPEAFLHPPQQRVLNDSLVEWARGDDLQTIIATHSAHFISFQTEDLTNLIHVCRPDKATVAFQLDSAGVQKIFEDNSDIRNSLHENNREQWDVELEAAKHCFWLNPGRCGFLFADFVLIVEGISEQAICTYLMREGKIKPADSSFFILDVEGKWNIPRFIRLCSALGIRHSVLYDADRMGGRSYPVNSVIESCKTPLTRGADSLDPDLETFLGIARDPGVSNETFRREKASRLFLKIKKGAVAQANIEAFANKVNSLVGEFKQGAVAKSSI